MNTKTNINEPDLVQIKKYGNRRLYNMQTSSYVTLDDLTILVKDNVQFEVRDAKTGQDLTRQVLMQIILEQETTGTQMLPVELLRSLIRYYETDMHNSFEHFLSASMQRFTEKNSLWMEQMGKFTDLESIQKQQIEWFNKAFGIIKP